MINKPAPAFKKQAVVKGEFKEISLEQYKGKWVVLFFYPMDFTFVCPTELIAFNNKLEEFRKLNCEVLAASCDTEYCHLAYVNTPRKEGGVGMLDLPLIADNTHSLAKEYGVYIEEAGVALRGLFIIDPEQKVRQITVNDLPVGRSVEEVMRLVQAFQFVAEHGEVCPANWHKGDEAMKVSAAGLKEYVGKL